MNEARKRLADTMNRRRVELRLRWREMAKLAGIDESTLRRIRSDQLALTDFVAEGIERALEWKRGSVEAILGGGEPTPLEQVEPILLDDVERKLWAITDLPEPMRWDHIRAYRAEKAPGAPPGSKGTDQRRSGT